MAISAGDFRTGLTLIIDGDPCQVLDFQHVKPGKGAAILKTKMRNLKTGAIQEKNFNASTKFDQANISKKAAQFSYEADNTFYFMDMETYDTYELSEEQVGYNKYFIVEGTEVYLVFFEGLLLNVSVSEKVELTIVETDPAIKGAGISIHINPYDLSFRKTLRHHERNEYRIVVSLLAAVAVPLCRQFIGHDNVISLKYILDDVERSLAFIK